MEKAKISAQTIEISNPSQLVLNVDDFLRLSKKLPSQSGELKKREQDILYLLDAPRKNKIYDRLLMFEINIDKIADDINDKYQDGFYLEDEKDDIRYPFSRTIRTKPIKLESPYMRKELSPNKITSIKIGKHRIIENNNISLKKISTSLLAFSDEFESNYKRR